MRFLQHLKQRWSQTVVCYLSFLEDEVFFVVETVGEVSSTSEEGLVPVGFLRISFDLVMMS